MKWLTMIGRAAWLGCAILFLNMPAYGQANEQRNLAIKESSPASPTVERRVALVIGNSAYRNGPLKNPVNDATDIAVKLRQLGFDVIERKDLKTSQIGRTLREFRARLVPGAVALFFYAGHGLQIKGENYLPTVDADIEGEEDVPNQSISMRQVLDVMENAKTRVNLAFLDACRNNPYTRSFRSGTEGLARISAPSGTLISFATRPGSVAADGTGRNGLYTAHLLKAIETPNQPVELMLKQVTSGVKAASRGQQEPWMEGSIEGDFYFHTAASSSPALMTTESPHSQREAINRAVEDAVRRANEQAAKERAELQMSIQKMIETALARQNATINSQSGARPSSIPPGTVAHIPPALNLPSTSANAATGAQFWQPATGDEWEYVAKDELYGRHRTLLWRVKAFSPKTGSLEALFVDGQFVTDWVFNGQPMAVGAPTESNFILGSIWAGQEIPQLSVYGKGACARLNCDLRLKFVGNERITVAAGEFDALRFEGTYAIRNGTMLGSTGTVTIWYSATERRLLRQKVRTHAITAMGSSIDETIELQAARKVVR